MFAIMEVNFGSFKVQQATAFNWEIIFANSHIFLLEFNQTSHKAIADTNLCVMDEDSILDEDSIRYKLV